MSSPRTDAAEHVGAEIAALRSQARDHASRQWLFHQAGCLERIQQLLPGDDTSAYELLGAWNRLGMHDRLETQLSRLLGRGFGQPDPAGSEPLDPRARLFWYLSHYHELLAAFALPAFDDAALFELIKRLPAPLVRAQPSAPVALGPHRPLRVGYLSPEFGQSVTMSLLRPLLRHAGQGFELYAYDDTPPSLPADASLAQAFTHWRRIHGIDNPTAAELIRADRIDILVDWLGVPNAWRYGLFALRPAPVQMAGLGFVFSSACRSIDYCLSDAVLCPPEIQAGYPETVIRLKSAFHWQAPEPAIAPGAPPSESHGFITFGSANSLNKLNQAVIACWASILRALPTARLFLKTPVFNDRVAVRFYTELFAHFGISAERLRLEGQGSENHVGYFYPQIDIALDAFPFQGGVTSCEALWMGVPVLSLFRPQWRTRALTASILTALGQPDWLTHSEAEYGQRALDWARDRDFLRTQRRELRQRMLTSPLCDGPGAAQELEAAYRQVWQRACAAV